MSVKLPLWAVTVLVYLVAPSIGEMPTHSLASDETASDEKQRYLLPRVASLAKKLGFETISDNPKLGQILRSLTATGAINRYGTRTENLKKRKFPEIDSRGFDEDIFDEGFGDWSPMKRW